MSRTDQAAARQDDAAREDAANPGFSQSESSAPDNGHFGAHQDGPQTSTNEQQAGLSPRKPRFMNALLDRLKVNGKRGGDSPAASVQTESEAANFAAESASDVSSEEDAWLEETQQGDSAPSQKSMTYTYPPGSTPLPRYTIRRGIGMGGFGEVYFALSDAGKEVALKRIQRNLEVELRGVSHCLNLKHPNLVALFDICRDDKDQSWVVMEYVSGPNLREVLDDAPNGLPIDEVQRWIKGISAGVHHLHSAGLVHRDLKPGNIFDDMGIVKVGDYGLSKFISASHRGGHTESVGTFHYMAPEIGRGQYGREIDIYALGVMLYELITGQVPFDGESCHEIIVKHLTATPELHGVAEPYRSTIARCLHKDPTKRFSTVLEMMDSLGFSRGGTAANPAAVGSPFDDVMPVRDEIPVAESVEDDEPVEATLVHRHGRAVGGDHGQAKQAESISSSKTHEEPFARAVRQSLDDLNRWWSTLDSSPGAKAFLVLAGVFVLIINTHWLLPMLAMLAVFYVPYYIIRQMVLHVRQQPTYAEAQRIATAAGVPRVPVSRAQWRNFMRTDLRAKRSVHRVAELNTSWVAASFSAIGLGIVASIIGMRSGPVDAVAIAPYAWMATIVLLGSVGILGMGKLWERDEGEALPRRLVLAGIGAGVGLAAFSLDSFLMLPVDQGLGRDVDVTALPQALYPDGVPTASAMMAHFAALFALLRWWKPVDPLRRTRLSFWAVAVAVVGEWAVHQVLPVPQPAGMLVAGGMAICIQLSAPWISPRTMRETMQARILAARNGSNARNVA